MTTTRPIDLLVDRLRAESGLFVPYVSAKHGGADAPILSVLRDPGPTTSRTGELSTDNADPTSRRQRELMTAVNLRAMDLTPWNAYPWAHDVKAHGVLDVEHVARGAVVLVEVIAMMRALRVLLLQGKEASWAWSIAAAFHPNLQHSGFQVVTTCHPLGTRARTPEATAANKIRQVADWKRAAAIIHT
jgi:hypothetical protein